MFVRAREVKIGLLLLQASLLAGEPNDAVLLPQVFFGGRFGPHAAARG